MTKALAASEEAARRILPLLEQAPYLLPDAGLRLVQTYITAAEQADQEPDPDLISRFAGVLQRSEVIQPN